MDKLPITGGPADGMQVAQGEKFVWLEVTVLRRAVRSPDAGLYELRGDGYEFIGGQVSRCECGGYYRRAEGGSEDQGCPICTTPTLRPGQKP